MRGALPRRLARKGHAMGDEGFCLFIIIVCVATLAMPAVVQTMFAVFATFIVLATNMSRLRAEDVERTNRDHHEVSGRG
jgi:hypothetical protein